MTDSILTQERLKELLIYDPETGYFINRLSRNSNSRAGAVAGRIRPNLAVYLAVDYKYYLGHRLAFLYMEGNIPEEIDHIDGIRSNNRWSNLRIASRSQNQHNARIRVDNRSGIKGLTYVTTKRYPLWRVRVTLNGVRYIKDYSTHKYKDNAEALAIAWLREKRQELHGEYTNHG